MKSFLDFEEKNVEKAVQKACESLNVPREKLKYDIISHGSSGIFGLVGTKKALIRVFVPDLPKSASSQTSASDAAPNAAQPVSEAAASHRDSVSALVDEAFGETKAPQEKTPPPKKSHKPRKPPKTEKKPGGESPKRSPKKEPASPPAVTEGAGEPMTTSDAPLSPSDAVNESPAAEAAPAAEEHLPPAPADREAAVAAARELMESIFKAMDLTAELSVKDDADPICLNIKIPEPGVLIGKRGQTLEAIQYLVDKIVSKQCGKGSRVIIDVEGYVEARKHELKDLATRLATKTLKSGKPSTMMRMNAHDRRIVHIALKRNPAVRTQSVGDGYYRKLIIFPKKKTRPKSETAQTAE